jgi:hypothetical protein
MSLLDLLVSASVVVPNVHKAVRFVVDRLGFPEPRPTWIVGGGGHGFDVAFCRTHPSMAVAPTRLELMCPRPADEPLLPELPRFYVRETVALQGDRPIRTHATVTASSKLPELIEHVRSAGVRHRVDQPIPGNPFARLWLGVSEDDPAGYGSDELFLEVVQTQSLRLKPETYQDPPPLPEAPARGALIRMVSRGYLVRDLDAHLKRLAHDLDWEPAAPTERVPGLGRRARMAFEIAHSAMLDLIEPDGDGSAAPWGPGPYSVRIAVAGLDAKAESLRANQVPFSREDQVLRVEPSEMLGTIIEFVDLEPPV